MPRTFLAEALPALAFDGASFPISPVVLDKAEFLLGRWALRACEHVDVNRDLAAYMRSGDPSIIAGNPMIRMWTPGQRSKWLGEARHKLFGQGRLLDFRIISIRLFLSRQHTNPSSVRHAFGRAGMGKPEADLFLALMADRPTREGFRLYLEPLSQPLVAADLTLCPDIIRRQLAEDVVTYKLRQAAMAKVATKLSFIAKSNFGVSLSDLATDALMRGLAYYLRSRPTYSRLHAANMAKSAMDGAVHGLIEYWTDPARARMEATPHGWSVKITSFDEIPGFDATSSITMETNYGIPEIEDAGEEEGRENEEEANAVEEGASV